MWSRLVAATTVMTIIGAAAWWLWLGPAADPPVGACGEAERAAAVDAPAVLEPTVRWQAADLPATATDEDEQVMLAVALIDQGWVASGRRSNGPDSQALMLWSTDGGWASGPADGIRFGDAEIRLLEEFDGRVLAAGSLARQSPATGVWVGRAPHAWQVVRGAFEGVAPVALAAGERSAVLIGVADVPAVWSSADGVTWDRLALDLPVDPTIAEFAAVRPDGDRWLAVGSLSRSVDGPVRPVVWSSSDGGIWSCSLLDAGGFEVAHPTSLHRSAQGWLAVGIGADVCGFGASCASQPIAWTSPDGRRWSEGRVGVEPWHTGGIAFAGSAEGFVAVGHGTTWWSADASSWVALDDGGTGPDALDGQPDALVLTDDGRLAVAGTSYDGNDEDAWIATGFLAR